GHRHTCALRRRRVRAYPARIDNERGPTSGKAHLRPSRERYLASANHGQRRRGCLSRRRYDHRETLGSSRRFTLSDERQHGAKEDTHTARRSVPIKTIGGAKWRLGWGSLSHSLQYALRNAFQWK